MQNKRFFTSLACSMMLSGLFLFFLVEYTMSFGIYDDGYGTEIYSDNDWLVLTMAAGIMLAYSIYATVQTYKFKPLNQNGMLLAAFCVSALAAFYPLGVFTKAMVKGKEYSANQCYLYVGIVGLIMLGLVAFACYKAYQNLKINK